MRLACLAAGLLLVAGTADAQLAITQPTERVLVLALTVSNAADSATSVQVMDAVRERLLVLARYKAIIITKAKLCEALEASGFQCNGLLDAQQAKDLARFLSARAYTVGSLEHQGTTYTAHMRIADVGAGMAAAFTVTNGNPGTPAALAEAIAQRIFTSIKASEFVRQCTAERSRSAFPRAVAAAQKALALDSAATSAHLCMLSVYEAQRMPPDSVIVTARRALKGDSLNTTAWERLASAYQQKGDTAGYISAYRGMLASDQRNARVRLGFAQLLYQMKRYPDAAGLLDTGLTFNSGDQAMIELKRRVCIEGSLWRCALLALEQQAEQDTTVKGDSTWLRTILGAAQQVPDTQAQVRWTAVATDHFPRSASFWKARGAAYELAAKTNPARADSAIWAYRKAIEIDPNDIASALLVAKAIVDASSIDSAGVKQCAGDTSCVGRVRNRLADHLDSVKVYLDRGLASPDSGLRLTSTVIMLTAGSKLAQAQAYGRAYPWLDQTLTLVAPRSPADTTGPRQQIRTQSSFWFGIASTLSLAGPYGDMVKLINDKNATQARKCEAAKAIADRIARTKDALIRGGRVAPAFAQQMLNLLGRYEDQLPNVKRAAKCTNF